MIEKISSGRKTPNKQSNKHPHDFPAIYINGVVNLPTIMGQNYAELTIDRVEAVCFSIELLAGFTNITKYLT